MTVRRTRILESAALLFANKGYTGASTTDIAEAAEEVTQPLIIYHFESKLNLFIATIDWLYARNDFSSVLLLKKILTVEIILNQRVDLLRETFKWFKAYEKNISKVLREGLEI